MGDSHEIQLIVAAEFRSERRYGLDVERAEVQHVWCDEIKRVPKL